jgi:sialidase-1
VTVFRSGTDGYHTFRIPAIVRTPAGTLLAFAEARRGGAGDAGEIDLVVRRSTDGGTTWGELELVSGDPPNTIGNPAPVVDPGTGDVVLLTVRTAGWAAEHLLLAGEVGPADGRRVRVQRSADDGRSWTAPVDITEAVKRPDWRWYATGPGHAIALRHGRFAGRLVVPANHSASSGTYGGHVLLSDDGGSTWRIGAEQPGDDGIEANETTAAELPDGRVYFSTRNQAEAGPARAQAMSADGGETFDPPYAPIDQLTVPVVQGSVLATAQGLLFSAPSDPSKRRRLAVRSSTDEGATWNTLAVASEAPAAYSDLVDLGGAVGVLYETGVDGPYEQVRFRTLSCG